MAQIFFDLSAGLDNAHALLFSLPIKVTPFATTGTEDTKIKKAIKVLFAYDQKLMQPEVHLFLIWDRGQNKRQEIIDDIRCHFDILVVENTKWDSDNYAQNLSRFYGQHLPSGSFKEIECGKGSFTIIIVRDSSPHYEERETSAGIKIVNTKMFDAKTLYRSWTGGGHKIHGTNNPQETRKDILLLTGNTYEHYVNQSVMTGPVPNKVIDRNLLGCIQWKSLEELFLVLNESIDYVVLRNFDGMPQSYYSPKHGDIDLLVSNVKHAVYLCNATPVFSEKYRTHYRVNINYQTVRFDIRFVGDGYYDKEWETEILKTRQWENGFYIPHKDHYQFSLLYHALMHKTDIPSDYHKLLTHFGFSPQNYMQQLKNFMQEHHYRFTEPIDHSVYFNARSIGRSTSFARKKAAGMTLSKHIVNKGKTVCGNKCKAGLIRLRSIVKRMREPKSP